MERGGSSNNQERAVAPGFDPLDRQSRPNVIHESSLQINNNIPSTIQVNNPLYLNNSFIPRFVDRAPLPPVQVPVQLREQDHYLPLANIIRLMRRVLPSHAKISDDSKDTAQECVSEFINFVTGEANEKCKAEQRRTITADDILWALSRLGFEHYIGPLNLYLQKYRQSEAATLGVGSFFDARASSSRAAQRPRVGIMPQNHMSFRPTVSTMDAGQISWPVGGFNTGMHMPYMSTDGTSLNFGNNTARVNNDILSDFTMDMGVNFADGVGNGYADVDTRLGRPETAGGRVENGITNAGATSGNEFNLPYSAHDVISGHYEHGQFQKI